MSYPGSFCSAVLHSNVNCCADRAIQGFIQSWCRSPKQKQVSESLQLEKIGHVKSDDRKSKRFLQHDNDTVEASQRLHGEII